MAETLTQAADPARMKQLVTDLDGVSRKLDTLSNNIQARTKALNWKGQDKDKFQGQYTNLVTSDIKAAVAALKTVSALVTKNAQEQTTTSNQD